MADEWVKMRISLAKDPKTVSAADYLGRHPGFLRWLADDNEHDCKNATEYVGRSTIVLIVVGALVAVWGMARQRSKEDGHDLILDCADLWTLDEIGGVPGLGEAMSYVGWAEEEEAGEKAGEPVYRLRFFNFLADGSPYGATGSAAAKKQKLYRERKKSNLPGCGNALRNALVTVGNTDGNGKVTVGNATVTKVTTEEEEEEEEEREEKKEDKSPPPPKGARTRNDASKLPEIPPELNTPEFAEAWADWVQHRSERKPKMTPTAAKQAFAKLAAWGPVRSVAAIKHSIAGSYQGIFENTSGQKPGQSQGVPQPVTDLQAIAAKQREREREAALHAERAERDRLARGGNIFAKPRPEPEPPHSPPADEEESSACPF